MSRLRLGLVGCGEIARTQHLPAIAANDEIELVAIADPADRAVGVPCHASLSAMLAAHPDIEAVSHCQPPRMRFDAVRETIASGRHALIEKPPAANLAEATTLADLAREGGVTLFAAWHSREGAAVEVARTWLASAAIASIAIEWKEDVRRWHPGQEWIWGEGGFGVFDPGINALSILTRIVDERFDLADAELEVPTNRAMPIAARLAMRGESGLSVTAEFDWRQTGPQTWDIRAETDRGILLLSHGGNSLNIDGIAISVGPEAEYAALYRRFAKLAATGQIDADFEPLRLVEEAFRIGRTYSTENFTN